MIVLVTAVITTSTVVVVQAVRSPSTALSAECAATELRVVSDPETVAEFAALADLYSKQDDAGCTRVRVDARTAAEVTDQLANETGDAVEAPRPQVWIPTSGMWSRIVTARSDDSGPVAAGGPPVIYSPLVLAMPRPMADALGWVSRSPTWTEIMDVLADPRGWATHGHPEWGGVTTAIADPARSTVGLATVSAMTGAARGLGQEDYLPATAPTDTALFDRLRGIRQTIAVPAQDTVALRAALSRADAAGPTQLAAMPSIYFVSERTVWEHNSGAPAVPMVAVYPADGSPTADHPYLLVDRDTMTTGVRAAAAGLLRFLQSPQAQDRLVSRGFRRGPASEGVPFTPALGLQPAPPAALLPATGGRTLEDLALRWNALDTPS